MRSAAKLENTKHFVRTVQEVMLTISKTLISMEKAAYVERVICFEHGEGEEKYERPWTDP